MKNKEEIQKIINCAPASRAFNIAHTSAANTTVSRAYALVLMLSGAACILMTRKVYHALPFILGIGMVVIGTSHTICGLWAKEYQSRETNALISAPSRSRNSIRYSSLPALLSCA